MIGAVVGYGRTPASLGSDFDGLKGCIGGESHTPGADLAIAGGSLGAPGVAKVGLIGCLVELYHEGVDALADLVDGILRHDKLIGNEV